MFSALEVEIKELGQVDWTACDPDELNASVVEVNRLGWMFEAAQSRLMEAFNNSVSWALTGAKTGKAWLVTRLRLPDGDCAALLGLASARGKAPLAAAAWDAGDISGAHVRKIARCRNHRTADAFQRDQARLVAWARDLRFDNFCRQLDEWLLEHDPDGSDDAEWERRERRGASSSETLDGTVFANARFDKLSGAIWTGELQRLYDVLWHQDWAEAKQRLGREPKPHELARTPQQRRLDAMVLMAFRSAIAPKDGRKPAPLFTIVLGRMALERMCRLEGGPTIAPAALLPFIDDAECERVLFEDSTDRVIRVSRTRLFRGVVRRILEVRDQECTHDDCAVPPKHCEGDHILEHAKGGLTSQENGRLRCRHHNGPRREDDPPLNDPHDE